MKEVGRRGRLFSFDASFGSRTCTLGSSPGLSVLTLLNSGNLSRAYVRLDSNMFILKIKSTRGWTLANTRGLDYMHENT